MKNTVNNSDYCVDIEKVNRLAKDPAALIAACEYAYAAQLDELCGLVGAKSTARVILLAGPSSSGKTTTAHKLADRLTAAGRPTSVVSLDDFYLGMAQYPRLPDGTPDMESVNALDLPLINSTLKTLAERGSALFPVFDFENSCRSSEQNRIEIGENGMLVMEGLHALNPRLVEKLPQELVFRAYVSTATTYTLDGQQVLSPRDTRLIRRTVRDCYFRDRSPLATLAAWHNVLAGEDEYITPFCGTADYRIDSSFDYEGCVFHHYILPMLRGVRDDEKFRDKVQQIIDILEAFDDIDHAYVPADSLLREFIGTGDR